MLSLFIMFMTMPMPPSHYLLLYFIFIACYYSYFRFLPPVSPSLGHYIYAAYASFPSLAVSYIILLPLPLRRCHFFDYFPSSLREIGIQRLRCLFRYAMILRHVIRYAVIIAVIASLRFIYYAISH